MGRHRAWLRLLGAGHDGLPARRYPSAAHDLRDAGQPALVRVRIPKEGDLAFYGTGHVELFRKWGYTYGAHDSGTVVSLVHYNSFWKPTAYYRIRTKR